VSPCPRFAYVRSVQLRGADIPSTERPERGSQLGAEQRRLFPRREVATLVDLVEVDQVAVGAPGPRLRGTVGIVGKYGDGTRQPDFASLLRCRKDDAAARAVLPVQSRG